MILESVDEVRAQGVTVCKVDDFADMPLFA